MKGIPKVAYTLASKPEALRRVRGEEAVKQVGREIRVSEQSILNWLKAQAAARLVSAEKGRTIARKQMEISRLRAENARLRMETGIVNKPARTLRGSRREVDRGNVRFAFIECQLQGSSTGRSGSTSESRAKVADRPSADGERRRSTFPQAVVRRLRRPYRCRGLLQLIGASLMIASLIRSGSYDRKRSQSYDRTGGSHALVFAGTC